MIRVSFSGTTWFLGTSPDVTLKASLCNWNNLGNHWDSCRKIFMIPCTDPPNPWAKNENEGTGDLPLPAIFMVLQAPPE